MKKTTYTVFALTLGAFIAAPSVVLAEDVTRCFESRKGDEMAGGGHTSIDVKEVEPGWPNVKCSDTTGGVLWWGDPFTDTEPMGDMPENIDADYLHEEAVVRPRADKLMYNMPCVACHNEGVAPPPANNDPRLLSSPMYAHEAYAPRDPKDFKHGNGAIWCLDCHSRTNRDALIDHRGNEISFNQPQKLCGKCHGPVYRDWRDGIHGKRIGMWDKGGKKRWWVCTECHNPHDTQPGFKPIVPEPPPELPKGMENADHERHHGPVDHGTTAASGDAH